MNKALADLIKISNITGKDTTLVQGGGGNTYLANRDLFCQRHDLDILEKQKGNLKLLQVKLLKEMQELLTLF